MRSCALPSASYQHIHIRTHSGVAMSEPRSTGDVRIVSRRMIRPCMPPEQGPEAEPECIHLTPWDLRMITLEYIQKGVLLPNASATGGQGGVVERAASSLARALGRFYPLAGRLATTSPEPQSLTISLRCSGEGAEFVHAMAPGVTAADVASSLYIPRVVWSFFPLDGLLGVDAVAGSRPVLAAQVTELADGVFIAMSLNHGVADGTTFWRFFNTWSELSRRSGTGADVDGAVISTPSPVFDRQWFLDSCRVPAPIPLPFGTVEDMVGKRVHQFPPVHECFLHFPAERVRELKAKANTEMTGTTTTTISSLQALLAHLWRAVCRARRLAPDQKTAYYLLVGCRGRVDGIHASYAGNAVVAHASTASPASEILGRGLGWAAWLLKRAVASFGEASAREKLARWALEPSFSSLPALVATAHTMVMTGSSPRFDVYGNDFGWGEPVAVRSGPANKLDGKATVYEGRGGQGSIALELCLAPEALARLVADEEFMSAVATPPHGN